MRSAFFVEAARRSDWFRRAPGPTDGPYSEWSHFVVLAPGLTLLANVALAGVGPDGALAPALLLAVEHDGWVADVELVPLPQADIRAGRHDCVLGESSVTLGRDGYRLSLRMRRIHVSADLLLTPAAPPLLANNAAIGRRGTLSWLAVPRLRASGTVDLPTGRVVLTDAPAYHDRNWGTFAWDGDFAWDWGFALPEGDSRWSCLFLRLTDRPRHRILQQGVWLWRDSQLVRGFRDGDVRFAVEGPRRGRALLTVPKTLDSLTPGSSGIPEVLCWQAHSEDDRLTGRLHVGPPLRIIAPSESGFTVVHESPGTLELHGLLAGEEVHLVGPALLEVANA